MKKHRLSLAPRVVSQTVASSLPRLVLKAHLIALDSPTPTSFSDLISPDILIQAEE
jgi:hypothetical protein